MITLFEDIKNYQPYNEQEEKDKAFLLAALSSEKKIFTRENSFMHMTSSAWIVNKTRDKVLMAYHKIYKSFSWLGGHSDGNENLLEVAIKEAKEESGLTHVVPLSKEIFSLEVLTVDGHIKRNQYVSSHLHLNVTYLLEADEEEKLIVKEDENSKLCWFSLDDAILASSEEWIRENIYKKLNEKLRRFVG